MRWKGKDINMEIGNPRRSINVVTADTRERKTGSENWKGKGKEREIEGERGKEKKLNMKNKNMRGRGRRQEGGRGTGKAEDQVGRIGIDTMIGPVGSGDLMTLMTMVMLTIDVVRLTMRETGQLVS